MASKFLILSSHTRPTLSAPRNHLAYATRRGYDYLFDATPYKVAQGYDQKLCSLIQNMQRSRNEWLLWMDEDAYFMNHEIGLERFVPDDPVVDFIICRSPVNPTGGWTKINTGVFFVRNRPSAIQALNDALLTTNETAKRWWNHSLHGLFVNSGDQERMLYVFETQNLIGTKVLIRDYDEFNARVYHFTERFDQHFICHLAASSDKKSQIKTMMERFNLNEDLIKAGTESPRA